MGEWVGSQAEMTIPFLPYSVSLLVAFDLSILFLISLSSVLWDVFGSHDICFRGQIAVDSRQIIVPFEHSFSSL